MATTPQKSPRRRGRPSKEEEVRQALAELGLRSDGDRPIANSGRHCREPIDAANGQGVGVPGAVAARDPERSEASAVVGDAVSVRAQELLAARRRAN